MRTAASARSSRARAPRSACASSAGAATPRSRARADGFEPAPSREAFFSQADVLTLHLPLNPQTRGLVTRADLARMKPTALFVNTSRAGIIEEGALVAALQEGRPGFAAVDVYEDEPVLGGAHPLLALPNALCTPHLGYVEEDALRAIYEAAVEHITAYEAGAPVRVVNPEALRR